LKEPLKKEEPSNKKYYIDSLVVGVIGSGNTSKMFHAVDLDCKEYAIKMYVKRFDGNTHLKKKDFENNGRRSTRNEVKNFELIYPKLKVCYEKLNKHHCVIMPFFDPVPKDKREGLLEDMKNVLSVFEKNNLKYKSGDVRWRHVGLYEGKCILYDLAELEPATSSFVEQHIKEFKNRANMGPHRTGQTFL
jgi:serine/threonine-protein kinase RIO1